MAAAAPAAPEPDEPDEAGELDLSFYNTETIGPLRAQMTEAALIAALGKPRAKQRPIEEGATGAWVSRWTWRDASAVMTADTPRGPWLARGVAVSGRSRYATLRGVRIGSTRAEVERLYPRVPGEPAQDDDYVVGSIYGGLLFTLVHDRVSSIAIGVFAF